MPPVQTPPAPPTADALAMQGYSPFTQGNVGDSPVIKAAIDAFNASTLPVIQQQLQLQGLGQSPIVASTAAGALGSQLTPLLTADMQNRLAASQGLASLYGTQGNLALGGRAQTLAEQMQPAQLQLERELGMGNLGVAQGTLAMNRELGQGNLALQRDLGMGNLGVSQGQLALQRDLGMGQLGVQQRGMTLQEMMDPAQLQLQRDLGMGGLGVQQRAQTLAEYMQPAGLAQQGQVSAAQIADQQAQRQLQAYGLAGQMMLGLANPYTAAMQGQTGAQGQALTGYSQAGAAQQNVAQNALNSQQMDWLRLQGLAGDTTTGLFGNVLPPSMAQKASTSSTK